MALSQVLCLHSFSSAPEVSLHHIQQLRHAVGGLLPSTDRCRPAFKPSSKWAATDPHEKWIYYIYWILLISQIGVNGLRLNISKYYKIVATTNNMRRVTAADAQRPLLQLKYFDIFVEALVGWATGLVAVVSIRVFEEKAFVRDDLRTFGILLVLLLHFCCESQDWKILICLK